MKKTIISRVALALLGLCLLFFSACDFLIGVTIRVINEDNGSITAWIVYGDDNQQT